MFHSHAVCALAVCIFLNYYIPLISKKTCRQNLSVLCPLSKISKREIFSSCSGAQNTNHHQNTLPFGRFKNVKLLECQNKFTNFHNIYYNHLKVNKKKTEVALLETPFIRRNKKKKSRSRGGCIFCSIFI